MTWLAADQTPPWFHPFWTIFMNQEAQFFDGPAKLAQRFDQPVIFQHIRRIRRGYYESWFEVMIEQPRKHSQEEIIMAYVRKVEEVINNEPELYLWSHRRWKHVRPAHLPVYYPGSG
jgi:KDO2-lipid IV(A) lauroyltransferase